MKINYLILAHKNLSQICRLVQCLSTDNPADFSIYIHIDKKWGLSASDVDKITSISDKVRVIQNRISCKLDDWSLIEAELSLASEALNDNPEDGYFVMMSGQDYPIKSNREFVDYCTSTYPKPLIDVTPWAPNNWVHLKFMNSPLYKFLFQIKFPDKKLDLVFRALRRGIDYMIPTCFKMKARLDKFGIQLYGGSQWWVLPTAVIKEIIGEWKVRERLINLYKKTLTPEETFFQTMTMRTSLAHLVDVNPPQQVTQDCPTFAYFNPDGMEFTGHPYIITSAAWNEIKDSDFFFARKFDETIDAKVFDTIDDYLLYNS